LQKIFLGVAPMVVGMCVAVFIVCAFPGIALWLPGLLGF
jgi:TRAP-type C4-dicarboxylate transport system permease large subunit